MTDDPRLTDAQLEALYDDFDMSHWPHPLAGTWGIGRSTTNKIRSALAELRTLRAQMQATPELFRLMAENNDGIVASLQAEVAQATRLIDELGDVLMVQAGYPSRFGLLNEVDVWMAAHPVEAADD